jgi:hypothetical protein
MSVEHWIKMRKGVNDSPKMMAVANVCGCQRAVAFDAVFRLLCWLDSHTVDGRMDYVFKGDIDRVGQLEGLGQAMEEIGWFAFDPGGCTVVDWERHNGNTAKKRLLDNGRQVERRRRLKG